MHALWTLLPSVGMFAHLSAAAYTLQDDYNNTSTFFDMFDFYTGPDPTNGFVAYLDQPTAQLDGLISASNGAVYIGVDSSNIAASPGRSSVRLQSINTYTHGLVILDLAHMPASTCGSWPAFWMVGSDWPNNGEIDIIEGVNTQTTDAMTLHTSDGCTIDNSGFTGTLSTSDCYIYAPDQASNAGCGISSSDPYSYGTGFNDIGGGVYATEWTSEGINIWFFPRNDIPSDITAGTPDPTTWGTPAAAFAGGCDIDSHFNSMSIIFDITFCGDWAGSVWSSDATCAVLASSCNDFVAANPTAFTDTYWSINSLKVYQDSSSVYSRRRSRHSAPGVRPPPRPLRKHRRSRHGPGFV